MDNNECENCNGTGWVDSMNVDGKIICLDCDGKGYTL